jgi:hypothetical protein
MPDSMNMHSPFPVPASPPAASPSALSAKWAVLHEAAGVVATLAGLRAEPLPAEVRAFPAAIRELGGWRRALAQQGVDDLAAIMEPGLAALLAVHAGGADPAAAALALWQEFATARAGLLNLMGAAQLTEHHQPG